MRIFKDFLKRFNKKDKISIKNIETLPKIEEKLEKKGNTSTIGTSSSNTSTSTHTKERKKRTFNFSKKDIINLFGRWIRITSTKCVVCDEPLRRNNDKQIVHYCGKVCRKNRNHTMQGGKECLSHS